MMYQLVFYKKYVPDGMKRRREQVVSGDWSERSDKATTMEEK
jgi:hypothetical protein